MRACAAAGVPLHVVRLPRRLEGGDFQARARDLRYNQGREIVAAHACTAIVTAHNRDDQAETILYRLVKYATPRGLVGMRPRDGLIARPLLCLGASQIREFCHARRLEYGEDVTNARAVYARNALRLEVVPLLERHILAILQSPRVAELSDLRRSQAKQRPCYQSIPGPHAHEPARSGVLDEPVQDCLGLVVAVVRRHDRGTSVRGGDLAGVAVPQIAGPRLKVAALEPCGKRTTCRGTPAAAQACTTISRSRSESAPRAA